MSFTVETLTAIFLEREDLARVDVGKPLPNVAEVRWISEPLVWDRCWLDSHESVQARPLTHSLSGFCLQILHQSLE